MRFMNGMMAAKMLLVLGVLLLIAERLWIPADTVFFVGLLFCLSSLRPIKEFDPPAAGPSR